MIMQRQETVDYSKQGNSGISFFQCVILLLAAIGLHCFWGLLFKPMEYVPTERLRAKRVNVILPSPRYIKENQKYTLTYCDPCLFLKPDDAYGFGFFRRMGEDPRIAPIPFSLPDLPMPSFQSGEKYAEAAVPAWNGLSPRPLHLSASEPDSSSASFTAEVGNDSRKIQGYPQLRIGDHIMTDPVLNAITTEKIARIAPGNVTFLHISKPVLPEAPMEAEIIRSCGSEELDLVAMRRINILLAAEKLPCLQKDAIIRVLWQEPGGLTQFHYPDELDSAQESLPEAEQNVRSTAK